MLIDTFYISGSQNTTKFTAVHCTVCYTATCFSPFSGPTSGCICLALRVLYHNDKIRLFWWWHLNQLMPCFYGGCIGSSIWMDSDLGCGMAPMV